MTSFAVDCPTTRPLFYLALENYIIVSFGLDHSGSFLIVGKIIEIVCHERFYFSNPSIVIGIFFSLHLATSPSSFCSDINPAALPDIKFTGIPIYGVKSHGEDIYRALCDPFSHQCIHDTLFRPSPLASGCFLKPSWRILSSAELPRIHGGYAASCSREKCHPGSLIIYVECGAYSCRVYIFVCAFSGFFERLAMRFLYALSFPLR